VDGYFKINPLKVELLHPDPKLVQVYDFVSDAFITKVMDALLPLMEVSETVGNTTSNTKVSSIRTAVNAWITWQSKGEQHLKSFLQRVELFTGLNVFHASELLQMAGYSPGGHYRPHYDCLQNEYWTKHTGIGERMATFMLYFNDVTLGGYTAFPKLGTAALPVKRSAVFWYNTKRNGECDRRTLHGACPVVLGPKYVGNLWIGADDNFVRKKCLLNPAE